MFTANRRQIEATNQRGGRLLSIVDLITTDTMTIDEAAFCGAAVRAGARFLTGAVPGGAGKTTLMAALLGMLPHEERIITASDMEAIRQAAAVAQAGHPTCLLAHEIGNGPWHGYIWSDRARAFLSAAEAGARLVTTLHADNHAQVRTIFARCGADPHQHLPFEMELFIRRVGTTPQRRVTSIAFQAGGCMQTIFEHGTPVAPATDSKTVEHVSAALEIDPDDFAASRASCAAVLRDMCRRDVCEFWTVSNAISSGVC